MRDEHKAILAEANHHIETARERMRTQSIRDPIYVPVTVVQKLVTMINEMQAELDLK